MRVTKEKELTFSNANTCRNQRSDLADNIERYWFSEKNGGGVQYLDLKDGKLQPSEFWFERTDVLVVQIPGVCNVFIEADGTMQVDLWRGVEVTEEERKDILCYAAKYWHEEKEFVEREKRFLDSQPWKQIYGMTPQEGVRKLRELGW